MDRLQSQSPRRVVGYQLGIAITKKPIEQRHPLNPICRYITKILEFP